MHLEVSISLELLGSVAAKCTRTIGQMFWIVIYVCKKSYRSFNMRSFSCPSLNWYKSDGVGQPDISWKRNSLSYGWTKKRFPTLPKDVLFLNPSAFFWFYFSWYHTLYPPSTHIFVFLQLFLNTFFQLRLFQTNVFMVTGIVMIITYASSTSDRFSSDSLPSLWTSS